MKKGFIPALGTPLDQNGNFCAESYKKQIEDQLKAGAVGVLVMGSMGQQAFLPTEIAPQVAEVAVEAVAGRVPVFVGCMDCSIAKATKRMASMEHLDITGFVFTSPYYEACTSQEMGNFLEGVVKATKHKIYLYDLPSVTQFGMDYDSVVEWVKKMPNIAGVKSGNLRLMRLLKLSDELPEDFNLLYSGLDTFDVAYKWGITNCLDGMATCTPVNFNKLFTAMEAGDYEAAQKYLGNIVALRDFFLARDLWPAYSVAMNLLGYEGNHAPDYTLPLQEGYLEEIRAELIRIGEL